MDGSGAAGAPQEVGGDLRISSNGALTSVDGLENLTEIGGTLEVSFNDALSNLEGLSALDALGTRDESAEKQLFLGYNPALPQCWLETLREQTGAACVRSSQWSADQTCVDLSGVSACSF